MQGFFDLKTPSDLREKLRRELVKLKAEPLNTDNAFNFFVTCLHILDWINPGMSKEARALRRAAQDSEILLEISSHLGNGAKHFSLESHHKSVSSTQKTGSYFAPSYFGPSYFGPRYFGGESRLVVMLDGAAAAKLSETIGVIELAEKVMEYWDNQPLS